MVVRQQPEMRCASYTTERGVGEGGTVWAGAPAFPRVVPDGEVEVAGGCSTYCPALK